MQHTPTTHFLLLVQYHLDIRKVSLSLLLEDGIVSGQLRYHLVQVLGQSNLLDMHTA